MMAAREQFQITAADANAAAGQEHLVLGDGWHWEIVDLAPVARRTVTPS
jgi:hypothetical protein